ncbi:MFS transporter [Stackebrandtia nassauensis]|uniref:MFS transporter n=1 Tax=Stackebrandtia nassauensis TaxID=283811 RepID=UPI0001A39C80|nr:MFS transporter [Stackebrandtia nassauensis]
MPRGLTTEDPPQPSATGPSRAIVSLRASPRFRFLWVSNIFFFGGTWIQTLILGWLVFETTDSELLLAIFTAVRLTPMLLGPIAGVLSDRYDRVRLLTGACLLALGTVVALATLTSLGMAPYWVVLLGGLIIGLAHSPSQPARSSLVAELVGPENLSNANALNSMAMSLPQVVGPAIGGALISALGASWALWISTLWYVVSLLMLLPLRGSGRAAAVAHDGVLAMLTGGVRSILRNRLAATVLGITVVANILLWPIYQSFMPVFAKSTLGLDAAGLGWLLTCNGVGGLVGSIVIAAMGDFRFKGGVFVFGTALWGGLWSLFALSANVPLSFALLAGIGVASSFFGVLQTTLLLLTTEPAVQGRALGIQELAIGVMPIAALGLGAIAEVAGIGATTFVSALLLVAVMLVVAVRVPLLLRFSGTRAVRS